MGTILEAALATLRRRWRTVLLLALAFAGPAALFTSAAGIRFNEVVLDVFPGISEGIIDDMPLLTAAQLERLGGAFLGFLLATLVAGLLGSVGAVASPTPSSARASHGARRLVRPSAWPCDARPASSPSCWSRRRSSWPSLLSGALAMTSAVTLLSSGPIARGGPGVFAALLVGVSAGRGPGLPDDALGARLPGHGHGGRRMAGRPATLLGAQRGQHAGASPRSSSWERC